MFAATQDTTFTPPGRALPPALISGRRETDPNLQTHHHPRDKVGYSLDPASSQGFQHKKKKKMNGEIVPSFDGSWKPCSPHSAQAALGPIRINDIDPSVSPPTCLREEANKLR